MIPLLILARGAGMQCCVKIANLLQLLVLVDREQHHSCMEGSGCCEHGSGTHLVLQIEGYHQLLLPRGDFPPSRSLSISCSSHRCPWDEQMPLGCHLGDSAPHQALLPGLYLGVSIDILGTGQALRCMRAAGCMHRLQLSALIHVAISAALKHGVICREKKPTLTFSVSFC